MAAIYSFRTSTYARNIYIFGTTSFDSIPIEYHEPSKQYAAANYTRTQIDTSYKNLWINEQEFQQTLSYIPV